MLMFIPGVQKRHNICRTKFLSMIACLTPSCCSFLEFSIPYNTSFNLSYYFLFPLSPEISMYVSTRLGSKKHRGLSTPVSA